MPVPEVTDGIKLEQKTLSDPEYTYIYKHMYDPRKSASVVTTHINRLHTMQRLVGKGKSAKGRWTTLLMR